VTGVKQISDVVALEGQGDSQLVRLRVDAAAGDVAERIFAAVVENKLVLRELRREQTSLEDVFTRLTVTEPAADRVSSDATEVKA
jgi:hypothetical protein